MQAVTPRLRRTSLCLDLAHNRKRDAPTTSSGQGSLKKGWKDQKAGLTLISAGIGKQRKERWTGRLKKRQSAISYHGLLHEHILRD